jgi:hypothetical protein
MYITDDQGWRTPGKLAKRYIRKKGKTGVSKQYMYQLINQEMKEPGSTDIDVIDMDGVFFVRLRQDVGMKEIKPEEC